MVAGTNATATFIPAFLASWLQLLAPDECFDEFFVKFNILHVPCLKILISKCLGYAIIVGSFIVKVPQIIKILKAKSGEGISLISVTLELFAISAAWAYGAGHKFPFSAYGEAIFLAIQTGTIAFLVCAFSDQLTKGLAYISAYVGIMGFLLSPAAPMGLLAALQAGNVVTVSVSKLIQASANYKNKSTGQLSVITVYMLLFGSTARIFTSIQETGDTMVVLTYVAAAICNSIVAGQFIYYWNSPKTDSNVSKKIQ
ncbi:mannose-p-dolichol utilization defect 1 protein-like [Plakobranchus ocellatus]|uniref:Mannose-P-dolichol utilization defect 1 protein homolog n=1 Tax=Plakobranchus ocellatus TaxID=259542 RepID=A0AAV3Y004_9GAST|nr:mannose-p-dolichol utilization defect 1 protein-like [Plakobranchus ocellatus]